MVFIFGGAYQGKFDFAKINFNLSDGEIMNVNDETEINAEKKCVNGLHAMILEQIKNDIDPLAYFLKIIESGAIKDKIFVCDDISSGVVPIDPLMRKWREACGRCAALLTKNADEVWRVFCGIATRLK